MSCEHLVCAQCAGPVVEGRCPVCRAGRERVHGGGLSFPPQLLAALALVALLLTALALRLHG